MRNRISGLKTPRILLFVMGVIQGKILKTAGIDEKSGLISASYITAKVNLYNEFSNRQLIILENATKALRTKCNQERREADCLEEEIKWIPIISNPTTVSEKRDKTAYDKRRSELYAKLQKHEAAIVEQESKINSAELNCREELDAIANALRSRMVSFTHGVLAGRGLLAEHYIPQIGYDRAFELYEAAHA